MAGEKFSNCIVNLTKGLLTSNFLYGIVTGVKPIKIKVDGLPELKENQIILSDNVKEKKIKIPKHKHTVDGVESSEELEEITLWGDLKAGDKVFIIQSNDKQLFYVLEVVKE